MQKYKSLKISYYLVFCFFSIFSFFTIISNNNTVSADGPCTCNASGKCEGCSPQINDLSCGTSNYLCDNAQKRWSCEHTIEYASTTPGIWSNDIDGDGKPDGAYLCTNDLSDSDYPYTLFRNNAVKGSWSEVFKSCFCSTGQLIQKIIDIAIYSISGIALIVLGLGGIKYITSQNNPDKITEAKETILAGVVGLILVLFSIAIINLFQGQLPSSWGVNFLNIP